MRSITIALMASAFAVAGCSERAQDQTGQAAEAIGSDIEGAADTTGAYVANGVDATGEAIEDGAQATVNVADNAAAGVEAGVQGTTVQDAKTD